MSVARNKPRGTFGKATTTVERARQPLELPVPVWMRVCIEVYEEYFKLLQPERAAAEEECG